MASNDAEVLAYVLSVCTGVDHAKASKLQSPAYKIGIEADAETVPAETESSCDEDKKDQATSEEKHTLLRFSKKHTLLRLARNTRSNASSGRAED